MPILIISTGLVVLIAMWRAYRITRDAMAPMVVIGPLLLYLYAYTPLTFWREGSLGSLFPDALERLEHVQWLILIFVSALCMGCLNGVRAMAGRDISRLDIGRQLTAKTRSVILRLAWFFAVVAFGVFIYKVELRGGFVHVFSRPKPYLGASSGYISELPMLAYPAMILAAIAMQGRRIDMTVVVTLLVMAWPQLMMATLGGRRGPAFLVLCTLAACFFIIRKKKPDIRTVFGGIGVVGLVLVFLATNRHELYIGSDLDVDTDEWIHEATQRSANIGNEYVYGGSLILTADYAERYYWGKRLGVLLFVRPIPRQIWPTKYEDLGVDWMEAEPGTGGYSMNEWQGAVGFVPLSGSAGGFVADAYIELWWFGAILCYFIGRVYSYVWRRASLEGGFWLFVYVILLALSVYLVAQSVGAWLYRALLICVPTWVMWRWAVEPLRRRRQLHVLGPEESLAFEQTPPDAGPSSNPPRVQPR
ncbi:MAG: oligosaccharide repeat unit polymerase [Phycisphaera sp.]|nr:oligosaccharide repeat unit polymerase [Phycisphaera sp.]